MVYTQILHTRELFQEMMEPTVRLRENNAEFCLQNGGGYFEQ
jgi:hypothetical protein